MSGPLFSVLVNNFNYARYIGSALNSILRQTLTNFELIIVDDGSTDDSTIIIRKAISVLGSRALLITKENGGQATSFNSAIEVANDRYYAFLDSDDLWHPRKLERVARAFERWPKAIIVQHNLRFLMPDGSLGGLHTGTRFQGWAYSLYKATGGQGPFVPTSGLCLRADPGKLIFPLDPQWRICADMPLGRIASLLGEIRTLREPLGQYRVHNSNNCYGRPDAPLADKRKEQTVDIINEFLQTQGEESLCIPPPVKLVSDEGLRPKNVPRMNEAELIKEMSSAPTLELAKLTALLGVRSPRKALRRAFVTIKNKFIYRLGRAHPDPFSEALAKRLVEALRTRAARKL